MSSIRLKGHNTLYTVGRIIFLLFVALAFTTLGHAQSSEIDGSVADASHAQIQAAKITLIRAESGEKRITVTNGSGIYAFPVTLPGHYTVTAEKEGFRTIVKQGIQVLTGQKTQVDFALELGQVVEQVEVSSDGAVLQTESSTISSVVENKAIANYALPDRRASQLQRLNGFVQTTGTGSGMSFDIAGGRGNNANYFIDGGTATNLLQGVETLVFDLPIDSLEEFNVSATNYTADQGQSGGGIIQMTTKAGTNKFHGSGYLYYRTQKLAATPYFAATNPLTGKEYVSPLNYKLFGGSIGGPILKDKTHFFFTWEGIHSNSSPFTTLSLPSADEVSGDFRSTIASLDPTGSKGYKLIDPNTGVQAVYNGNLNVLPPSEIDPYSKVLASYYPTPNVSGATANTSNYIAPSASLATSNTYVARIDHVLGEHDTLYGRFLGQPGVTDTKDIYPTPGTDGTGSNASVFYYSEAATYTHTFSPAIVNELRLAFTQRQGLTKSHGIDSAAEKALAFPGVNSEFFPGISISGLSGIGNTGTQERLQTPIRSNEFTDNLTWQRGAHQFKFGLDYRTSEDGDYWRPSAGGQFSFNNTSLSANQGVASFASFLLGRVYSGTRTESLWLHSLAWAGSAYAQDAWKVTPHLTANLGIRWDLYSPRYLANNYQNSFNPTAINPVSGTPGVVTFAGINGQSRYANDFDDAMFGPRLGLAYNFHEHWVFRGGAAIQFPNQYDAATPITAYTGFSNATTITAANTTAYAFLLKNNNVTGVTTTPATSGGLGNASFPTTSQLTPGYGAVAVGQTATISPSYYKPNKVNGYLYQFNFDIQRELPHNLLLDVTAIGTFGHHLVTAGTTENLDQVNPTNQAALLAQYQQAEAYYAAGNTTQGAALVTATAAAAKLDRPYPQFTGVGLLADDRGESNYRGLNIGLQKRYSGGLQYQVNYTWARFIDNQQSQTNFQGGYPGNDSFTDYYNPRARFGYSTNDVRDRIIGNVLYDLPIGRGKLVDGHYRVLNEIIGGWSASLVTELRTGGPLGAVVSTSNASGLNADAVRPYLVGNPNDLASNRSRSAKIAQWFDTSAFSYDTAALSTTHPSNNLYTFGNAPRTIGRGPGLDNTDGSLIKKVTLHDTAAFEFRAETFNLFNHANLANPNQSYVAGSTTFGTITGVSGAAFASRTVQLGAHLTF